MYDNKEDKVDLLPKDFVEVFESLDNIVFYSIKKKYKSTAVIYLWFNKETGRTYVGRTVNIQRRLGNYCDISYLKRNKDKMPICGALLKYMYDNKEDSWHSFSFYILQGVDVNNLTNLGYFEHSWVSKIKPSYNIAAILDPFVGTNHPRYGKSVSKEIREKISNTLKGRKLSVQHVSNIMSSSKKTTVYCYDFYKKSYITQFSSIRAMCRDLNLSSTVLIQRKLNNNKAFSCIYKDKNHCWLLCTTPLSD